MEEEILYIIYTNSLYNTGRNEANYSKGPPTDWGTRGM